MENVIENINDNNRKEIYNIALRTAELLLRNGSEVSRANDTVKRILSSYGFFDIPLFLSPTVIIIGDSSNNSSFYLVKNIETRGNNIGRVNMINAFSRDFCAKKIEVAEAMQRLDEIAGSSEYSFLTILLMACIGCAMFTLMLGGSTNDFLCSIFTSALGFVINEYILKLSKTPFLGNFISSLVATFAAVLLIKLHLGHNLNMIVVGSILPLVPGVAFTSGIRDFLSGDLISGIARSFEAVFVAVAIAFGVGSVLVFMSLVGGI